ncbi:MAG: serine/threonine-protein phosphatase [Phycisphaeraceae bacterium]|nr:serine/threonine-protein phosphatase [Phycisphaeraceae bacterium]
MPHRIRVLSNDQAARDRVAGRLRAAFQSPAQIDAGAPDAGDAGADAVVLVVTGDSSPAPLAALAADLEEAGRIVLVLGARADDLAWFPAGQRVDSDIDMPRLAAMLEGMLRMQSGVASLQREIATAHRFHGGLEGQIMRIQEELELAARIQREFLPRELPAPGSLSFAAFWRPAHFVSGDIYDVQPLDAEHIGFFLADCVGHGVPAALMTMTIVRALTTRRLDGDRMEIIEPAEVLTRLNADLVRHQSTTPRFATAIYGVIHVRTRRLRLSGAGHPHPILYRADGATELLATEGGLLGIFADAEFDQTEATLGAGDRLVLYSDGFEQIFARDPDDGLAAQVATEFRPLCAAHEGAALEQAIVARVNDRAGSLNQADDLTCLCIAAPVQAVDRACAA